MTTYKHIVQVYPVDANGKVNLSKVRLEEEFDSKAYALKYVEGFNDVAEAFKAVYLGRVNDQTGELG